MPAKLTTLEFINRAIKIHGNLYDYSLVEYKHDTAKVKIICSIHGIFEQRPMEHVRAKNGCRKCAHIKNGDRCRKPLDTLISQIEEAWGQNTFDFSRVIYKNDHSKIELKCLKHDEWFSQYPGELYKDNKIGCPKCVIEARNLKNHSKHQPNFIKRCIEIHGDLYDYSKTVYINQQTSVTIICKKHGEFIQKPGEHLAKCGCQKCNYSKGEHTITRILNEFQIEFIPQYKIKLNNKIRWCDFYLPNQNMIIEFNGSQHYKPTKWTHNTTDEQMIQLFKYQQESDQNKRDYCIDNNIKLLEISYKDYDNIHTILSENVN